MKRDELHIYLDSTNKNKILPISNSFDKSPTRIVNLLLNDMASEEIEDRMLRLIQNEIRKGRRNKITLDKNL